MKLILLILLVIELGGTLGCKAEAVSSSAPPPPEVEVVTVVEQSVPDEPEFIGQTEASRPVEIRSQVTGIIKQRFFSEGRDVKKGDILYRIDPVPFRAAVVSARGRVAQAEARLVQAKQNLARLKPLLSERAVSHKDVDDAVAEELASKAALEAAKGDLVKAKFDLDNTAIIAPIDGLIERTRFYEGRLITAQTDLLTVIHQVDPMYVIANAPESFLLKRRREVLAKQIDNPVLYDLRGTLSFMDGTTYSEQGSLDFADVGLQSDTGSRQVRMVFPNPNRILLPGQFVKVKFHGVSKPHAILVPQRAVQQGPKGSFVFVVDDQDRVEIRAVDASNWQGSQWVIQSGLRAGERVVVAGLHKLAPGTPVKPVSTTQTPASAASAASQQATDAQKESRS